MLAAVVLAWRRSCWDSSKESLPVRKDGAMDKYRCGPRCVGKSEGGGGRGGGGRRTEEGGGGGGGERERRGR